MTATVFNDIDAGILLVVFLQVFFQYRTQMGMHCAANAFFSLTEQQQ